jgi:hypothetical protein
MSVLSERQQLRIQDVLTHLAEYYAAPSPTKRSILELAFTGWFRVYAESGDPLAKELLADPNWMRRFPVLFNNSAIDRDFIRRRLAIPVHLTDERDMFWRVRTSALGEVAQYLDAAYEKAVRCDDDAERGILIDALMTVAQRDRWSAWIDHESRKLSANGPHAIGTAAALVLTDRRMLPILASALEGRPSSAPITLDVLFKLAPDVQIYFRKRARSTTA